VVSRAVYFGREDIGTGQKKASRLELSVRRLAASAAKGDIGSAAWLLKLRAHAEKYRDAGPTIITIIGGLPQETCFGPTPEPMRSTKADRCAGDRSASDAGQAPRFLASMATPARRSSGSPVGSQRHSADSDSNDGHLGPRSDREWRRQYGPAIGAEVVQ
jgi:hypothetical protein